MSESATGSFHVSNGSIIDPSGVPFVARGVGIVEGNEPSADALQANFPGVNFVRYAIYDYANPSDLSSYVNSLTSKGIVVELEDHTSTGGGDAGGSAGQIFTGDRLNTELNWYASAASAFKDNADVWFGTNNEPSETDSSGNNNPAALSTWQHQTYDAVRNAGNNSPVMLEANSWGVDGTNIGYTASDYAGMTNVVWDVHYYGWISHQSNDQSTVSGILSGMAKAAQHITSADGTIPVVVGEYGNSTDGQSLDPNADQVLTAVQTSGYGSAAWVYLNASGDGLVNADGSPSWYGQEVASFIASSAASNPASAFAATSAVAANLTVATNDLAAVTQPTYNAVFGTASDNNSTVVLGSNDSLTDWNGNTWSISDNGVVTEDGGVAGTSTSASMIALVDGTIWEETTSNLWLAWNGSNNTWRDGPGISTSPLPA